MKEIVDRVEDTLKDAEQFSMTHLWSFRKADVRWLLDDWRRQAARIEAMEFRDAVSVQFMEAVKTQLKESAP